VNRSLAWYLFSMELRKALSYRVDFWVKFLVSLGIEVAIAWFLWRAVFEFSGKTEIGGYTFVGMIFYSIISRQVSGILSQSDAGNISVEIYQGTLNRYLIYPVSFYLYKLLEYVAQGGIVLLQTTIVYLLLVVWLGSPPGANLGLGAFVAGVAACCVAFFLYFAIIANLEMIAFWFDNVWSLLVMVRFITRFLGGAMIPLTFYPERFQEVLIYLPFPYVASFPIRSFMGQVNAQEWIFSALMAIGWGTVFMAVSRFVWRRGLFQYSGVGI